MTDKAPKSPIERGEAAIALLERELKNAEPLSREEEDMIGFWVSDVHKMIAAIQDLINTARRP